VIIPGHDRNPKGTRIQAYFLCIGTKRIPTHSILATDESEVQIEQQSKENKQCHKREPKDFTTL
jgi:hypothetical protein